MVVPRPLLVSGCSSSENETKEMHRFTRDSVQTSAMTWAMTLGGVAVESGSRPDPPARAEHMLGET